MSEKFVLVDIGCIECGEQTEILGVFDTLEEAATAGEAAAAERGIKNWGPNDGWHDLFGSWRKFSTYLGGCGYFTMGQRSLELHVYPARKTKGGKDEEQETS